MDLLRLGPVLGLRDRRARHPQQLEHDLGGFRTPLELEQRQRKTDVGAVCDLLVVRVEHEQGWIASDQLHGASERGFRFVELRLVECAASERDELLDVGNGLAFIEASRTWYAPANQLLDALGACGKAQPLQLVEYRTDGGVGFGAALPDVRLEDDRRHARLWPW